MEFEFLLLSAKLENLFGFQKYDSEGYPIEEEYEDEYAFDQEDEDDGFDTDSEEENNNWE